MDFNFGNIAETNYEIKGGMSLKPYSINKVKLVKIAREEIQGKKDPNAKYKILSLEFAGEDGTFKTNLFLPSREEDLQRRTYQNSNGHDTLYPSSMENYQSTLMQIVHTLNPEAEAKIKEMASKIKTIDQFTELIEKALANVGDIETNLKLVGRVNAGVTYADLPSACGIDREGKFYLKKFIGENLSFNNSEMKKKREYENAAPTPMNDDALNVDEAKSDDTDYNDLLNSL